MIETLAENDSHYLELVPHCLGVGTDGNGTYYWRCVEKHPVSDPYTTVEGSYYHQLLKQLAVYFALRHWKEFHEPGSPN